MLECPKSTDRLRWEQRACRESLQHFYVLTNCHSFGSGREAVSSPQIRQLSLFISSFKLLAHKRKATKSGEACLSCAHWNTTPTPARYRPSTAGGTGCPWSRRRCPGPQPAPVRVSATTPASALGSRGRTWPALDL